MELTIDPVTISKTGTPAPEIEIEARGDGYSDHAWYFNGVAKGNEESFTFSTAGKDTRVYTLGLRVKKEILPRQSPRQYQWYYAETMITVTR